MSIIGDYRDELDYERLVKLMELISQNLEVESPFLTSNPQTLFTIKVEDIIETCADLFGYAHETVGKIFNEIMDKKELKCTKEQS